MGRSPCCDKVGLKKGPWTPEEDQKLLAFIQEHGHGSWRALPPKAGLQRCGKSCRLRWTNYLRPDIKRGKFSLQEEQTIIQLHALLGNRWSAIASHLPKRTDNEIKNYWNTHLKKRLVKMGIDPITHKPKNHALGCTHPSKDSANLSHMAQWESARLEAEARIVRESGSSSTKHLMNHIISYNCNNNVHLNSSAAPHPPRPPCLDILKVWQGTWARTRKSSDVVVAGTTFLDSPTSILNFSDNTGLIHVQNQNSTLNNINYQDELQLQGKMLHDHVDVSPAATNSINNYVAAADHRFPSFMDAFADLPPATTTAADVFEDNKINYWSNILNVANSPMGSPVF